MHLPRNLLDRPAPETARLIALAHLDEAHAALRRLRHGEPEGLHDFRVSLRRLRTTLRGFRRELGPACTRFVDDLIRVSQATNRSRDYEAQSRWALGLRETLTDRQVPGLEWLLRQLKQGKRRADRRMERVLSVEWDPLRKALRRRLRRYRLDVRVDRVAPDHTAAPAVGKGIRRLASRLEDRLLAMAAGHEDRMLHRARIAAKRLRYFLEPFEEQLDEAGPLVQRLRRLQDLLGGLHDGRRFLVELDRLRQRAESERTRRKRAGDPRPGLLEVRRRLVARDRELRTRLEREWDQEAAEALVTQAHELAEPLMTGEREHREIERKYLLRSLPPVARMAPAQEIEQGWLPGDRIAERVRRVRAGSVEQRFRTIKAGRGLTRLEIEEELPAGLFEHLWPLTEGRRVTKRRHRVDDRGLVWEIDDFADRNLVLAEVELPAEDTEVEPPEWIKPYVVREVTGEDEYVNLNLAR